MRIVFQFQNGAIKSFNIKPDFLEKLSFNSKMVRLREIQKFKDKIFNMFQFQNGAIKSGYRFKLLFWQRRFNSKMVRLRVILQSQHFISTIVSIPKWCD